MIRYQHGVTFHCHLKFKTKKATINIKNEDDNCFIYCLGRALDPFPEKAHLESVSKHLKSVCETLGLKNIKTPVNEQDLPKIEKQFNISINLFSHMNSDIYPIRVTQSIAEKHVDLLITLNSETNHYVLIKNFNKLCFKVTKNHGKKYFCEHCIQHFTSEERLKKHVTDCMVLPKCQAIEMPVEGECLKFKSFRKTIKISFVIYADLEALLEKLTVSGNSEDNTEKRQKHNACSHGYKVVCCYDAAMSKPFKIYRGLNSVNNFSTDIFEEEKEILAKLQEFQKTPMNLSSDEKIHHKKPQLVMFAKVILLTRIVKYETIVM